MKKKSNKVVLAELILFISFSIFIINPLYSSDNFINDTLSVEQYLIKANNYFESNEFDKAIIFYQKISNIYVKKSKWEYLVKTRIQIAECYRIQNNFDEAAKILSVTEKEVLIHLNNTNRAVMDLFHKLGTIYSDSKKYEISNYYLNKSIDLRIEFYSKEDTALAISYNSLGNNYYDFNIDSSLYYYKKALEIGLLKKEKENADNAMFYQNIGIIYARKGEFDSAKYFLNKSLLINNKILQADDYRLAKINLNIAYLNYYLEDFESALEANAKAENIYINKFGKKYFSLGTVYLNKGNIYNDMIDYKKALEHYKNALTIYQAQENLNYTSIAKAFNNIGSVYNKMKEYEKALNFYQKTLSIKNRSADSKVITLRNIAKTNMKIGDLEKAKQYFKYAIKLSDEYLGNKHYESAHSYSDYADFCLKTGEWEKGKRFLFKALKIYSIVMGKNNADVTRVLAMIGDYYYNNDNCKSACVYYHRSILSSVNNYSNESLLSNPSLKNTTNEYELLYPLYRKAQALNKMYINNTNDTKYLKASVRTYELIISLIDKIRKNLSEGSSFILSEKIQDVYYQSIKTAFLAYNKTKNSVYLDKTFKFIEKNKAAILLSSIRGEEAIKYSGISDDSRNLEKKLKKKISAYEKQVFDQMNRPEPDEAKITLWDSKLFYLQKSYDSLINRFEIESSEYYHLKYDTTVISIPEIQSSIDKEKAVIQFVVFEKEIFTSVIKVDTSIIISTKIDSLFFRQVKELHRLFSVDLNYHDADDFLNYILLSNNIYNILLRPVQDVIKNKSLVIIPDGILGYIPFGSLVTKIPGSYEINYRTLPYLIRNHTISYSYSATLLFKNSDIESKDSVEILAFRPSYTDRNTIMKNDFIKENGLFEFLVPLEQAKDEVNNISKIFRTTKYEYSDTNEQMFTEYSPNYNVLHLAMHTIVNDTAPMYSKLVFTLSDDTLYDNFLNTYEVYNLDLDANMVVLSACNTGSGKMQKGEGIMSLARGFIYCGVPSIVMTLWEVNDMSGAKIMTKFYKNLKNGFPKDEALQLAKLNYLDSAKMYRAHPFYWSQYVCIGKTNPIIIKSNNLVFLKWAAGVLAAIILLLIILGIIRNINKKK